MDQRVIYIKDKRLNPWKVISLVLAVFFIILISIGSLLAYYMYFAGADNPAEEISAPIFPSNLYEHLNSGSEGEIPSEILDGIEINEELIEYALYNLDVYGLHPPPFSSDLPVIEVDVDGEVFTAKIEDGEIITNEGSASEKDITFYTNKQTLIEAVVSEDTTETIIESVENGESYVEITSSQTELALKGYLGLYNNLNQENVRLSPISNSNLFFIILITGLIILIIIFLVRKNKS